MSVCIRLQDCLDALGDLCLQYRGDPDLPLTGASADSRTVRPGYLFCAIRGAREDGTAYIHEALRAGAVAVAAEAPGHLPQSPAVLHVADAYAAAGRLAEIMSGYPGRALRLVGITGTNGKTTCAFLLRDVLAAHGCATGLIGTVRYEVGTRVEPAERTTPTPFKYQKLLREMVTAGIGTAVVEVSSHALAQQRLGTAPYSAALFTNLTQDHLDYHVTLEAYYACKKRLFSDLLPAGAIAVINADNTYGKRLLAELAEERPDLDVMGFGNARSAHARIRNCRLTPSGCSFTLGMGEKRLRLKTPLIGRYNAANVAGVAAMALRLGVKSDVIAHAIRDSHGAPGRLQRIRSRRGFTVFIDYAHTPDALRNVLGALRGLAPQRLLVLFGCGGDRDRTKRPIMGRMAAELADRLYVTSDNPRSEPPADIIAEIRKGIPAGTIYSCQPDRAAAIREAIGDAQEGDIVLIAGKGHESYQEIHGQKHAFDDMGEVRAAIDEPADEAPRDPCSQRPRLGS